MRLVAQGGEKGGAEGEGMAHYWLLYLSIIFEGMYHNYDSGKINKQVRKKERKNL